MSERTRLAKEWLLNSGIQDKSGPFHSWYDPQKKAFEYLYSEITGYGMTALLFLNAMEKNPAFIRAAERAASWLMKEAQDKGGGFKTRKYRGAGDEAYSFESGWIYTFDCGVILCGLMNLWEATGGKRYLAAAAKTGDFLVDRMRRPDGSFWAYRTPSGEKGFDDPAKWSSQSGSYHAKLSLGLIKLGHALGKARYIKAAEDVCSYSLSLYRDGRFITGRRDGSTHLHPHCYTIEGLAYAGLVLGRKDLLTCALEATRWALGLQAEDGGIPTVFFPDGSAIRHQRSDILAQVLRAGSFFRRRGLLEGGFSERLDSLTARLFEFQNLSGRGHAGAFLFGSDFDGSRKRHFNSWCTMFAVQAISFYEGAAAPDDKTFGMII